MADKQFAEKLRQAIEANRARPAKDRWDELIARGAIDSKGKVLIRGPEVSGPTKAKAKPQGK